MRKRVGLLFIAVGAVFLASCSIAQPLETATSSDGSEVVQSTIGEPIEVGRAEAAVASESPQSRTSESSSTTEATASPQTSQQVVREVAVTSKPVTETTISNAPPTWTVATTTPTPVTPPKLSGRLNKNAAGRVVAAAEVTDCDNGRRYSLLINNRTRGVKHRIVVDCEVGVFNVQQDLGQYDPNTEINVVFAIFDLSNDERVVRDVQRTTIQPPANPVPANSGTGRRIIYDRRDPSSPNVFKVWLVDSVNGQDVVSAFYQVRGNASSPLAGEYRVRNRSRTAFSGPVEGQPGLFDYHMNNMVRFVLPGEQNNELSIGFHSIPCSPTIPGKCLAGPDVVTPHESGGCIRQNEADSQKLWDFVNTGFTAAQINSAARTTYTNTGTKVVVLG